MEGERGGDQEGDSWKPQREARREGDSHKAVRPLSTLQGVARQERVQNPSTSPDRISASHVSALPKRELKKAHTRKPSKRTTTTTEQQHPGKQTQHQLTRPTKSQERRVEGERGGDQEGDSWKPQREVRRECDSHKAARSLSTLQGVARQERVQNPSTSPKDGAGTPYSKPKTSRSQQPPTERKLQAPRTQVPLMYFWGERRTAQNKRGNHQVTTDKQRHQTGPKLQTRSEDAPT